VVWRWDSDTFGTTAANQDPDADSNLFVYNLRFPGQYFDAETGLHYNYMRDYDPAVGQYIESDAIGLLGGTNTYVYAEGSPTLHGDPFGLDAVAELNRRGWGLPPRSPIPFPSLQDTKKEMEDKDVPGTDQYFHCLGTCRAKKNGSTDEDIRSYTNAKEYLRDYPLGRAGLYGDGRRRSHREMMDDIARDQRANEQGLACPSNLSCFQQCSSLLDNLPARYRPFMQKYRTEW